MGSWNSTLRGCRVPAGGRWICHRLGSGGSRSGGPTAKGLREGCLERGSGGISPGFINHQAIILTFLKSRTDFLERSDASLDATRIDNQSEPGHCWVPKFFVDFKERKLHIFASLIL